MGFFKSKCDCRFISFWRWASCNQNNSLCALLLFFFLLLLCCIVCAHARGIWLDWLHDHSSILLARRIIFLNTFFFFRCCCNSLRDFIFLFRELFTATDCNDHSNSVVGGDTLTVKFPYNWSLEEANTRKFNEGGKKLKTKARWSKRKWDAQSTQMVENVH